MKIHIQSDTHIETGGPIIEPAVISNVTICAGDIGLIDDLLALERYFNKIKETTDHVIWVLGNHEFYYNSYNKALNDAKEFADRHNIHLMDIELGTDNLTIDGVTFWGSTLWTDLAQGDWFAKTQVNKNFSDFYVIKNDSNFASRNWHVDDTIDINRRTREAINWNADVIITHHCPIMIDNPRFPLSPTTYGFHNTGLEEQIVDCKAKYWVFGHTHHTVNVDVNGTLVISNQHGYSSKSMNGDDIFETTDYDPHLIIEI